MFQLARFILPLAILSLSVGCQSSDTTDCDSTPQAEGCLDNTQEEENLDPEGTQTQTPSEEENTTDPEPEPEANDPMMAEAPQYHDTESLLAHLSALDDIAIANQNNRAAGTAGYEASVDYVQSQLESWGYEVTLQGFTIDVYDIGDDPILELTGEESTWAYGEDYSIIHYSSAGDITGSFVAVDVDIPPGNEANSSNSGCQPNDFQDFPTGAIAVVQRGSCTFEEKAMNAQTAGAVALVIFNEGQDGREDFFEGAFNETNEIAIPVLSASYAVGLSLVNSTENPENTLHIMSDVSSGSQLVHNVIVEYPGASGDVWMIGGHLDSVPEGPGINDNGTGVSNILETARYLSTNTPELAHGIRIAFWAGEELGLLGSTHYVRELSNQDAEHILGYLNLDMIGSPNPGRFIYDGDASDYASSMALPEGSGRIEKAYEDFFNVRGVPHAPTQLDGRSDYYAFMAIGIASGGLFSGAEDLINSQDAELFELSANDYYDACYHQACDGIDNIHTQVFTEMSDATTHVVLRLAEFAPEPGQETTRQDRDDRNLPTHIEAPHHKGCHGPMIIR